MANLLWGPIVWGGFSRVATALTVRAAEARAVSVK
ncbi:hypothetical protein NA66_102974 [Burkholderia pyrrocinia]|uniref:Uncharacterized protein n=1 Tax=Burkholderia pyrrocinia TaxID=60550 RepID=A0A318IKU7_BURPY|nr:hypothetical protein NA66_102974 [Burkholderia pyrrocinia]